ncbi:MAG: serine hydrolase, partial [Phenylobacterium sp.]|nr:serine hydrolase [Phenylobacterium sp.]
MGMEVHGTCDPRFEAVRQAFAGNLENGLDVGASFAATVNGEFVIDIWGGFADPGKTRSWEKDTLV